MSANPTSDDEETTEGMSIGALSRATGIPVATLRSWERRYGFPEPTRRESGHRRYGLGDVDRLRLIKQALELGNRPSDVVSAPVATLEQLIQMVPPDTDGVPANAYVGRLMAATRELDERALGRTLQQALDDLGIRRFVYECVAPFLRAVGDAWVDGRLGVMHEHFASVRLRQLLAQRRRAYEDGAVPVVCAALPGELHDLGLYISALLLAFGGAQVIFLGADTPAEEIGAAALQSHAVGVLVGSSRSAKPGVAVPQLGAVRRLLPPEVRVAVGGLAEAPPGVTLLPDFQAVERWCEELLRTGSASR